MVFNSPMHNYSYQYTCEANLVTLNKADGGVRLVAIEEFLCRLTGKTLFCIPDIKAQVE